MIPIRDTIPSKNYPVVRNIIIGINAFFYLLELTNTQESDKFFYIYGIVPARYTIPEIYSYFTVEEQIFSVISFMFLHGGILHLLGNMWSLYIFGDNVEDHLGHFRFLIFYLLCGIASGISHILLNPLSNVPTIGASGAIAGIMGAYMILYPNSKVLTLIPIIFIPYFIEIPAYVFLGIWFLIQFISATSQQGGIGGIAWWAHIGGFISGIIFLKLFNMFPHSGITEKMRKVTEKKRTDHLQIIQPFASDDSNLYGNLIITPNEALSGTTKLVNIPWGFYNRLFKINVPPGIKEGGLISLNGLGIKRTDGNAGDLILKIFIRWE